MPPLCLFCLEEIKESQNCPNVIGCECEVNCHPNCLQEWFQQKQQIECPICHVVRIPNPVHRIEPPREFVIVHVQGSPNPELVRTLRSQEKCIGMCCGMFLLWWIIGLVFEFAF